ncbi:hypothetical protein FIE12Z_625 [Fusarium flagelliforme]|uniref:Uncharacterized protein n=1 Tax=Fusarium flagelliforme TaxID=2675880 RepID=A0A395N5Q5_9HYPO|nr:hypothetical protein FIE12Z_625 [Fusarium flagelliforme]
MASKGWKEHIVFPSYIGEPEEDRPVFIGPLPTVTAQRRYMRKYLRRATGTTQEWENNQRLRVELSLAKAYTDEGAETFGKREWEYTVNKILWRLSFTSLRKEKIPAFPWEAHPRTGGDGRKSEIYMSLRNSLRAELGYDALVQ